MITAFEFALIALAARALAWYWVSAGVAAPAHERIERAIHRRGWPKLHAHDRLPPVGRVVASINDMAEAFGASMAGEPEPTPRGQHVWRWVHKGFTCSLCSGQWMAFIVFGLWTSEWPWDWGWQGFIVAVAANAVGIIAVQLSDLTVTFCPTQDAVFSVVVEKSTNEVDA